MFMGFQPVSSKRPAMALIRAAWLLSVFKLGLAFVFGIGGVLVAVALGMTFVMGAFLTLTGLLLVLAAIDWVAGLVRR